MAASFPYVSSSHLRVACAGALVQTLSSHLTLCKLSSEFSSLVFVEVHKRLDPFYSDSRDRIKSLGSLVYFSSYMSQPKSQLETFRHWAGKASDISYYLNSHHVDFTEWCFHGKARPIWVVAAGSYGLAKELGIDVSFAREYAPYAEVEVPEREEVPVRLEHCYNKQKLLTNCAPRTPSPQTYDTITLTVTWENLTSPRTFGTATYTSSWVSPPCDVHSQQRFSALCAGGEINIDQARRGYTASSAAGGGLKNCNPLFMKYEPKNGKFAGQKCYGYESIERFVESAIQVNDGSSVADFDDGEHPSVNTTTQTTAVLEAGKLSLDEEGARVDIVYDGDNLVPTSISLRKRK